MRNIGTLPTERDAERLSSVLYLRGIENSIEGEDHGEFSIWVHDDRQLETGRQLLAEYRANPAGTEFQSAETTARRARAEAEKADKARGKNIITQERLEYERNFRGSAWLPISLIVVCLAVAVQSDMIFNTRPSNTTWLQWLGISRSRETLSDIRSGEVWRLFTPIFIHYGLLHLFFNSFWLRNLGGIVQQRYGVGYLAVLILAVAAISNLAQFWWKDANFGGMSGVNYGLFGFLWIRGKVDRFTDLVVPPAIVQMMLMWLVLCMTGLVGDIANAAHLVGLAAGSAWGYATAMWSNRSRR